jgi:hypothetical protein
MVRIGLKIVPMNMLRERIALALLYHAIGAHQSIVAQRHQPTYA